MAQANNAPAASVTVLILEEDVLIRLSLGEYLRGCGFNVVETAHGDEARVVILSERAVDVVLADAQSVGEGGGFAFAQWLRRRRSKARVILTATVLGKAQAAAELCDKHQLAPKPCDHAILSDRITAMMATRARKAKGSRGTRSTVRRVRRIGSR